VVLILLCRPAVFRAGNGSARGVDATHGEHKNRMVPVRARGGPAAARDDLRPASSAAWNVGPADAAAGGVHGVGAHASAATAGAVMTAGGQRRRAMLMSKREEAERG